MKKTFTLSLLIGATFFCTNNFLNSNPVGAPAGRTGSPADGQTCGSSGCHGVTPTDANNVITSDVPTTGYVPSTTYTITVNITGGGVRKGFQVSPQNNDGTLMGTIAAGAGNKIVSSKYVTHSSAKTTNPSTWTFSWTAPAKGTGAINFYGAFVNGFSNVSKQVFTVQEATGTNIAENNGNTQFTVFQNPLTKNVLVSFNNNENNNVSINIISLDGKHSETVYENNLSSGIQNLNLDLNNLKVGIYILQLNVGNKTSYKKIVIQ